MLLAGVRHAYSSAGDRLARLPTQGEGRRRTPLIGYLPTEAEDRRSETFLPKRIIARSQLLGRVFRERGGDAPAISTQAVIPR